MGWFQMDSLKNNLVLQFSIVAFLVMVLVAVSLVISLTAYIQSDTMDDLATRAIRSATGPLLDELDPSDLDTPMAGERYARFDSFVQSAIVSEWTARIKLWSPEGVVIYSSDPDRVGASFPDNENVRAAMGGEVAVELELPDEAENEAERALGTLMSVYTPLVFPGQRQPRGVLEIYEYFDPVQARLDSLYQKVYLTTGLGFAVLFLSLLGIVWKGWRTIRRQNLRIYRETYFDAATGLPNKRFFLEQTDALLQQTGERLEPFGMLYLDLKGFNRVIGGLGHSAGDELLGEVGRRIKRCLRSRDLVARIQRDEFAILLSKVGSKGEAERVSQRIRESIEAPFTVSGQELFLSVSIGVALFETSQARAEDIMRSADNAMQLARMNGNPRHVIFDEQMHQRVIAEMRLEAELRHAIDHREFVLHYQPLITLGSRRPVGFEALVRWQHPTRGLVSPPDFIPFAEQSGLITQIGQWVLREACSQLCEWQQAYALDPTLTISVNLSGAEIADPDLLQQVTSLVRTAGINPANLALEVTESQLIEHPDLAADMLQRLKELGVRVYLDDFGTGYSSLSYLQSFPVEMLKIDRSFVSGGNGSGPNREILRAVTLMGHSLGIRVTAEGVETADQLETLTEMGCDFAQGFFIAKPMHPSQATEWLDAAGIPREALPSPASPTN